MAAGRMHHWVSGWPLRTRLVALLMGLVAVGLLVAGLAAVTALRGYLYTQVDRNLEGMAQAAAQPVGPLPLPPDARDPSRPGPVGPQITYAQWADATGVEVQTTAGAAALTDPPVLPVVSVQEAADRSGQPFVVDSESGATRWRALIVPLADGEGSVTVAQDIGGIDSTVSRLILIEVAIGLVVLVLLGLAGRVLIRASLRPLEGVEQAAAAIAAGDLAQRAPGDDPRTEIGSLASSFNTMADNVQGAFAAQAASESRAHESAARAQASETRMRQFVADASHELRTPLTSVRGFAELYRIGAVDPGPPLDDAMGRIENEAARMGVLVDDLLLLARLDQQRPMEQEPVDLVGVVGDAVVSARVAAPQREIEVEVDHDSEAVAVLGDAAALRQVVDNLVSNALRYSPSELPVRVHVGTTDDGRALVEISDQGEGMAKEVADRAFERFFRADVARSRERGARAWAWRSWRPSWPPIAARSRSTHRPGSAPPCASGFRSP